MVNMDANIYLASVAAHNLNPTDYSRLNIVSYWNPSEIASREKHERLFAHAEQKLLWYSEENGIDVAVIHSYRAVCPDRASWVRRLVKGFVDSHPTCDTALRRACLIAKMRAAIFLRKHCYSYTLMRADNITTRPEDILWNTEKKITGQILTYLRLTPLGKKSWPPSTA